MPKRGFVYILASAYNGTLYIGVTNDLTRRVWEHKHGLIEGFTKRYGVYLLVYYEVFDDIRSAITREKLDILRQADAVYLDEIRKAGLYDEIWQAFAVLLPVKTVGVMGDGRTYEYVCGLRAVTSTDGMTADFYPFDMNFLARAATRIINEVKGVNRVVYDVTSKPPGTIEWE